ncbi:hypothetical protein ACHAXN_005228 [Cyclotella atomus]
MASSAEAARLASKTGLAAAATALVGAFYSSFDNKRSNNDDVSSNKSVHLSGHHALLPPPLHLSTAYCEKPKLSEAGNVIKEQEKEKPKSSDPADYAGGAAQFGASASDAEGLVRILCKEACLLEHIVGSNKSNFALQLPTNKHIQQYHGLFPRRQLWRPRLEYPLWDYEWDADSNTTMTESQRERWIRKEGVTRHVILIRHGQYDETYPQDEKRILTPLGRLQAQATGKRIGEYIRGVNAEFGPCHVKVMRVSDLARAKETAQIIHDNLGVDMVEMADPDELLNEGRPCHHIPGGRARQSVIERTDEHHPRIEKAFRKYFYQSTLATSSITTSSSTSSNTSDNNKLTPHPKHEFEIIVCHANVIRYFFRRALQLPPEAWLRLCVFNCSLTYLTIRPTGSVSCRMLGDIGHLPYELSTFSMHTGFNW